MSCLRLGWLRLVSFWLVYLLAIPVLARSVSDGPRIVGGEPAPSCAFPSAIEIGGCTGTLVHPKVVITAWHCNVGGTSRTIKFGETSKSPSFTVGTEACKQIENGSIAEGRDFAFCVLEREVTNVPVVPILAGCEVEILKPGQEVWMVGFGTTSENGSDSGTKRFVNVEVNSIDANDVIHMGGDGKAGCYGDSGGPTYVQLEDGSWRVFGVDSDAENSSACGNPEIESMMHIGLEWFQSEVRMIDPEIDLTPCFDDAGQWEPSEKCGGFPLEIRTGGGSWDEGCADNVELSGPSSTCGPAFDATPPSVEITDPDDNDSFDQGQEVAVAVSAQDNVAVVEVELWLDGALVETLTTEPYEFVLKDLDAGEHALEARARDAAGNETTSDSVAITINAVEDGSDETSSENGESSDESQSEEESGESSDDENSASDASDDDTSEEGEDNSDAEESSDDDDDDDDAGVDEGKAGCSCDSSRVASKQSAFLLIAALAFYRRRSRR
jgi:hypothetical protein